MRSLAPDLIRPIVDSKAKTKMNPTRPLVIHERLPREIMAIIFEEHTELEWCAPAIDGRVCHTWRQIVLDTPRAWIYLEIRDEDPPRIRGLREWLDRSGSVPLYIRVKEGTTFQEFSSDDALYKLLRGYRTRIASLRFPKGDPLFFIIGEDFPCLRLLEVNRWASPQVPEWNVKWDSMPELRSLRLTSLRLPLLPPSLFVWSGLTQLEALNLYFSTLTSLPPHFPSLTTLVLDEVSVTDAISNPMAFPSLTYLSLRGVTGLKPYINAPCFVTYHEGGNEESFSSPVPSLVEYGVSCSFVDDPNPASWHLYFPNMSRLSIRASPSILKSFFRSLSRDSHSLPALQTISVRVPSGPFEKKEQEIIRDLVRVRGEACQTDIMLYFDMKLPFQMPLFFGEVSHYLSNDCECLMPILEAGHSFLKFTDSAICTQLQVAHKAPSRLVSPRSLLLSHPRDCAFPIVSMTASPRFPTVRLALPFSPYLLRRPLSTRSYSTTFR